MGEDALLERDRELDVLRARIGALRVDGLGGVVVVEGPPGIGKTTLLGAVTAEHEEDGLRVLRASGSELEGVLAFGAVRQLLGSAVLSLDEVCRERVFAGPAALARRVLGLRSRGENDSLADPVYGLYWLTVGLSEMAPLLIVVDDAHWLDEESGRFVAYLSDRLDGVRILLLVASWPEESGEAWFLERVRPRATRLRLRPLSESGVETMLGRPASGAHSVTGGNPLLVRELARTLALAPDTPLDEIGPRVVARRMLERVRRVSDPALALAEAVSLFSDGAPLDVAAAVAQLSEDDAIGAADNLIAMEVLLGEDRLRFQHPLMRRAIYDDLHPHARRRWHARAAAELRRINAPVESIAAHLLTGVPRRNTEDMRILVAAADDAQTRGALAAAARYLERALDEGVGAASQRSELRGRLGAMLAALGRPEAVAALRQAAGEATDSRARADFAIQAGIVAAGHGHHIREALLLLRQVRDASDLDPDRRLAIECLIAQGMLGVQDPDAVAALDRLPDDLPAATATQRMVLSMVAYREYSRGSPASYVRALVLRSNPDAASVDLGSDSDDSTPLLVSVGALDEAAALANARLERARMSGSEAAYAAARMILGRVAYVRGDLVGAEAEYDLALEMPSTPPRTAGYLHAYRFHLLLDQGRVDEAEALCGLILRWVPTPREALIGTIAFERGDYRAAAVALRTARTTLVGQGVRNPSMHFFIDRLVEAAVACGQLDEAHEMIAEYRSWADRFGETRPIGIGQLMLGRHTAGTAGQEHLEAAHALLDASPYRLEAARGRLELGSRLRRDGKRSAARQMLLPALEYAVAQRAAPLAARLREELTMCGARPRRVALREAERLTPAEERIAKLAADGRQNKEIAQQLFLTVGTVQTTLVTVYRKLHISSRRDLPTALNRSSEGPAPRAEAGPAGEEVSS